MMKKQKEKTKKGKVILAAAILCILILGGAAAAVFAARPSWKFLAKDRIRRLREKAEYEFEAVESIQISEERLLALAEQENVIFDQSMMLINAEHTIPDEFAPEVGMYKDTDVPMNLCIMDSYQALSAEIRQKFDVPLYVRSAYRTREEQEAEAAENAEKAAAAGASEHEAGLALDVYVPQYAGSAIIKTKAGQYLNTDCWRYGFIIRYPYYGTKETGIGYEPWHIRYVGAPHAELMARNSMTMEEYLETLTEGTYLAYDDYLVTRQSGSTYTIPVSYESAVISPDNCGGYIMTFRR